MSEIFVDRDYDEFEKNVCSKCEKFNWCWIEVVLKYSRWNQGKGFPTHYIKRIDREWKCDDYREE